jgi:hypothetical protein
LKENLRQILLGDYEHLEAALESLLPEVWQLRIKAMPIFAQIDLTDAIKKVEVEFASIPTRMPLLAAAAENLSFGVHLMGKFLKDMLSQNPNLIEDLQQQLSESAAPSFSEITLQLTQGEHPIIANFIHGSVMMEVLLFAIDLADDEQLPLEYGICYELGYQSAVAVEEYGLAIGLTAEKMPWYSPPQNDLQWLLLEGPVLSEPDIQYITEKRKHLNSWK